MPATLTYPGVYIEEIPSGVHTITGVATSITAFIGRAKRGPVDSDEESPIMINSFGDFERIFGGLWPDRSRFSATSRWLTIISAGSTRFWKTNPNWCGP